MTDTQTPERIVKDCLLAAKCLEETNTFETGQAILRDAAKELEAIVAERDQLKVMNDEKMQHIRELQGRIKALEKYDG